MLYKLTAKGDGLGALEPLPFLEVADLQKREKDLENLLASHLLDVLFEDAALQPIFQERSLQAEADIYALNKSGDLVIFELKRGLAFEDAVLQAIRYAQDAGRWIYSELQRRYDTYMKGKGLATSALREAHREAFQLEAVLQPSDFNRRQHLYIVGSAANEGLISAIDYWKRQGLSVEFLPYRIYDIGAEQYFEFFSFPYDRHRNPRTIKGVLFDTNRSWDENSIWEMMEKRRVAAYGDIRYVVEYLNPRDIVFFYHKWEGVVAAAEVLVGPVKREGEDEQYRDVRFLTSVPTRGAKISAVPPAQVSQVTGKTFFWARTIKVPYLDQAESQRLLAEVKRVLDSEPASNEPMQPTGSAG
jgi:hypothetical protein